jgi:hypothetical protein
MVSAVSTAPAVAGPVGSPPSSGGSPVDVVTEWYDVTAATIAAAGRRPR